MNINLLTWYSERELSFCPKHFIGSKTYIDTERYIWVTEKLTGRFYIPTHNLALAGLFSEINDECSIYFEDPSEAVYYELTWS